MKHIHIVFSFLTIAIILCSCNPDVELCREEVHPHLGGISYQYNWTNAVHTPDSMYVIANRVINLWKSSMVVNAHNGTGRYMYNAPTETSDQAAADTTAKDSTVEDSMETGNKTVDSASIETFKVRTGWYKFFTFSMDTTEFIYNNVIKFMTQETPDIKLRDLYVEYKTYAKNDARLHKIIRDWQDYNPYSNFIQPNMNPIYFDTIASCEITKGDSKTIQFTPQTLTQNIDIYFNVKKNIATVPFVIDSVRAEISGIPHSVNLSNGYVNILSTNKMMFTVDITNAANNKITDTYSTTSLRCHGNIDVLALISNSNSDALTGPGIMQVIIYTHAVDSAYKDNGYIVHKKMQGKINLYNSLKSAKLLKYTEDGENAMRSSSHGIININADVTIDGSHIIDSPDNDGGLDKWKDSGDVIIDI